MTQTLHYTPRQEWTVTSRSEITFIWQLSQLPAIRTPQGKSLSSQLVVSHVLEYKEEASVRSELNLYQD